MKRAGLPLRKTQNLKQECRKYPENNTIEKENRIKEGCNNNPT